MVSEPCLFVCSLARSLARSLVKEPLSANKRRYESQLRSRQPRVLRSEFRQRRPEIFMRLGNTVKKT